MSKTHCLKWPVTTTAAT